MTDALVRLYARIWRALVYRKWRVRYLARMERRSVAAQPDHFCVDYRQLASGLMQANLASMRAYNQQNALSTAQLLGMNNAR